MLSATIDLIWSGARFARFQNNFGAAASPHMGPTKICSSDVSFLDPL